MVHHLEKNREISRPGQRRTARIAERSGIVKVHLKTVNKLLDNPETRPRNPQSQ
jgi:hypothetical protein